MLSRSFVPSLYLWNSRAEGSNGGAKSAATDELGASPRISRKAEEEFEELAAPQREGERAGEGDGEGEEEG